MTIGDIKEIGKKKLSEYFWREAILEKPFVRGFLIPFDDGTFGVVGDFRRGPQIIRKGDLVKIRGYDGSWMYYRYDRNNSTTPNPQ